MVRLMVASVVAGRPQDSVPLTSGPRLAAAAAAVAAERLERFGLVLAAAAAAAADRLELLELAAAEVLLLLATASVGSESRAGCYG